MQRNKKLLPSRSPLILQEGEQKTQAGQSLAQNHPESGPEPICPVAPSLVLFPQHLGTSVWSSVCVLSPVAHTYLSGAPGRWPSMGSCSWLEIRSRWSSMVLASSLSHTSSSCRCCRRCCCRRRCLLGVWDPEQWLTS